ncbi:hypothetical protein AAD001_06055 [Colwelliaceae bacterium 6471]
MENRQFKFNIGVSLGVFTLGAMIAKIDASGVGLLIVGGVLTTVSLIQRFNAKATKSAKPTAQPASSLNYRYTISKNATGQFQCK